MSQRKTTQPEKELTRKQSARREREKRLERYMIWGAIAVGVLIVGVLAYGVISLNVLAPRRPVATVGDTPIQTAAFQRRVRYERTLTLATINLYNSYLSQLGQLDPQTADSLSQQLQYQVATLQNQLKPELASLYGHNVLDSMTEEELVRQEAARRGLTLSAEELHSAIEQTLLEQEYLQPPAAPVTETQTLTDTQAVTPTATIDPAAYDAAYQQFLDDVKAQTEFLQSDFEAMLSAQALRDKLKASLGESLATTGEQVMFTYVVTGTQQEAAALQARLAAGEDPGAIIAELQSDTSTISDGGDVQWLPLGYLSTRLGTEAERVAFNTPPNVPSDPVQGNDGNYYVLLVTGHEQDRPLDESVLSQLKEEAYTQWLTEQRDANVTLLDWEAVVPTTP